MAEQYKGKVDFYAVYILEAHPNDVWEMQSNVKDNVLFRSPRDEEERASVASACVRRLGIKFPALIDGFDNQVETAYTGWPDRMYLVAGGRVLYKANPGHSDFIPTIWLQHSRKCWAILSSDVFLDYSLLRPPSGEV